MPDTSMRAALYEGARKFSTARVAMPTRGPDEALLRVWRVGICGTDLRIFQGHLDHQAHHLAMAKGEAIVRGMR